MEYLKLVLTIAPFFFVSKASVISFKDISPIYPQSTVPTLNHTKTHLN